MPQVMGAPQYSAKKFEAAGAVDTRNTTQCPTSGKKIQVPNGIFVDQYALCEVCGEFHLVTEVNPPAVVAYSI